MKPFICLYLSFFLLACSTSATPEQSKKLKRKNNQTLQLEHKQANIRIVNIRPSKAKKCWVHNRHWHCYR